MRGEVGWERVRARARAGGRSARRLARLSSLSLSLISPLSISASPIRLASSGLPDSPPLRDGRLEADRESVRPACAVASGAANRISREAVREAMAAGSVSLSPLS
jgi:hypothetical protein